jgi:hypothetical protein
MTLFAVATVVKRLEGPLTLLAYIGPDVFLPVTSALAAIAGFLLMFWHRVTAFVMRMFGRAPKPPTSPPATKSRGGKD